MLRFSTVEMRRGGLSGEVSKGTMFHSLIHGDLGGTEDCI